MAGVPNQSVYVVINSVVLGTPAAKLRDYADLLATAPVRGRNRLIPGVAGRSNKRRRRDEKPVTLLIQPDGRRDHNGLLNDDPDHAVLAYIEYLDANLGVGEPSVAFEWHRYGLSTLGGDVQVLGLSKPRFEAPHIANVTLDLICPPTFEVLP